MSTEICPKCGSVFEKEAAPWLQKAMHCAKHDVVSPVGTECSACVAEKADEAERQRIAAEGGDNEVPVGGDSSSAASAVVPKKGKR
jgi:hypothetical protein